MKYITLFKGLAGLIVFIIFLNLGLNMISAPNTIENIIGAFVVLGDVVLMIKTRLLTQILINKNKKNYEE